MSMDSDLFLVIGIVLGAFAIPALLSAFSEGRAPRVGAILVMMSCGLIAVAVLNKPTGYKLNEIPDVFVEVIGKYTR